MRLGSYRVASPGIEPGSGASETLILSIVLRSQFPDCKCAVKNWKNMRCYLPKCMMLWLKILTAIASKITPKNLRTATIPVSPSAFSINLSERRVI